MRKKRALCLGAQPLFTSRGNNNLGSLKVLTTKTIQLFRISAVVVRGPSHNMAAKPRGGPLPKSRNRPNGTREPRRPISDEPGKLLFEVFYHLITSHVRRRVAISQPFWSLVDEYSIV